MVLKAAVNFFSNARKYAVVGASANPDKFGFKVLQWYINNKLPVVPINPVTNSILGIDCEKSITELIQKKEFEDGISISFVTPPNVTLSILKDLHEKFKDSSSLIKAVWLQPGTFNDKVLDYAKNKIKIENVIADGLCVMVLGQEVLDQQRNN
ncbi:CoA-binding protein [Ascoidea rubescens DSM 1968]|uniref:NAD(P)-binding protein n=1 Tax=Ascoidea rubescens DSM 1968 TaxID=1344418 RepID=A0A1D2VP50_9ASCO|nr:NAD(P)-binding protein [Ascoidea rubescens DSM 1968]ODV63376.1 NAD(P)-binding protein [Ascoidea rubescens DSM 1968]